jgi:hypothetical protein
MTGFSADWLALREPVDHRSRDAALLARLYSLLPDGPLRITDLGCGTGSNLRAMAPELGREQAWRLVDHDPALLEAARRHLCAWADGFEPSGGGGVLLKRQGCRIEVRFTAIDLNSDLDRVLAPAPDLVTAAALFDLVSKEWITAFAQRLAGARIPLYTVLTYDGIERWDPPHEADDAVLAAFHAHQRGDKGFGPAEGPSATASLTEAFRAQGYEVRTASSPWQLEGSADRALMNALATGAAGAAAETGTVSADDVARWGGARQMAERALIGHQDLLAWPLS